MPDPCLVPGVTVALDMTDDIPPALTAEVIQSDDSENGLVQRADGLWAPRQPIIVGSLPGSAEDGTERYLADRDPAGANAGTLWHCKYNADLDRWYFLGGPVITAFTSGEDTFASGGGYNWVGSGSQPSVGISTNGKYEVAIGFTGRSWDTAQVLDVGLSINNSDPTDDAIASSGGGGTASGGEFLFTSVMQYKNLILSNGDILSLHYRASGNSGSSVNRVRRRWIRITPIYFS